MADAKSNTDLCADAIECWMETVAEVLEAADKEIATRKNILSDRNDTINQEHHQRRPILTRRRMWLQES